MSKRTFGVILTEEGWKFLEKELESYVHTGPIGKYMYCRKVEFDGPFALLSFEPDQVENRINAPITIYIPLGIIKFIATGSDLKKQKPGFA